MKYRTTFRVLSLNMLRGNNYARFGGKEKRKIHS